MPGPGPCCILEVCCPPRRAKQALVEELKAGVAASWDQGLEQLAEYILSRYRLIPRDLDTETHERLDQGLRAWLKERGHPLTAS